MKVTLALAFAGALSCASMSGPNSSSAPDEVRIQEGTQVFLGTDLRIGVGNFWEEDGQLTCALWIAPSQTGERVKKGQVIERNGRRLEVVDISRLGGGNGLVVLKVLAP